jgi:hypothetical protein
MAKVSEADRIAAKFYYEALNPFQAVESCKAIGDLSTRRLVVNLASTAFHFIEHLPDSIRPSTVDWKRTNRGYKLLGDLANASKHGRIDRHCPEIERSEDIYECMVITQYFQDEKLLYDDLYATVHAVTKDGSVVDAITLLREVINLLGEYLHSHSILDRYEPLIDKYVMPVPQNMARKRGPAIVVRNGEFADLSQFSSNEVCLIITQGVAASIRFLVQAFDYETMQCRPMPKLSGDASTVLRFESRKARD